jgi:hypothetical protein
LHELHFSYFFSGYFFVLAFSFGKKAKELEYAVGFLACCLTPLHPSQRPHIFSTMFGQPHHLSTFISLAKVTFLKLIQRQIDFWRHHGCISFQCSTFVKQHRQSLPDRLLMQQNRGCVVFLF